MYRLRRFAWRQRWKLGAAAVLALMLTGYLLDRERQMRQVVAERYREIRRGDRLSVRTTGLPAQAAAQTVCGGAFSVYNPQTVALLRD